MGTSLDAVCLDSIYRALPIRQSSVIEFIFSLDYEIYGNGEGSLSELVYEPTKRLLKAFKKWRANFVVFVEVAELEVIESAGTDLAIGDVLDQLRELRNEGFELGLHLHPQWYNACREKGKWILDYNEYNLCKLPRERIACIVERAINYFQQITGIPGHTPNSFRSGNWLFQPSRLLTEILAEIGIRVDSSVFKGGRQRLHNLE